MDPHAFDRRVRGIGTSASRLGGGRMDRRTVVQRGGAAALALTLAARLGRRAWAQAAPDFSGLGYPELAITVTDTGFAGVPATTAAGRYLLRATNARSAASEN